MGDDSRTGPTLNVLGNLHGLPQQCKSLFQAEQDFFLSMEWFHNVVENGLEPGARPLVGVLEYKNTVWAIIPLLYDRNSGVTSLSNCYTCMYKPIISPFVPTCDAASLLGQELGRYCARWPVVRLDCMPSDWLALEAFALGVRSAGLSVRPFHQFGNWYEPMRGRSWDQYLSSRPSNLRELLRRRSRRASAQGIWFEIIRHEEDLSRGITAYEAVYRRSWKAAEPFPNFNPELMRYAARLAILRLGVCWRKEKPIAAQFWIVLNRNATVLKLAHDEAERSLSPGTLLTAAMIEQLITEDIGEIDFGRGDDLYKRLWADHCRERIGLLLINPRLPHGLYLLFRHDLGRAVRKIQQFVSGKSR